MAASSFLPAYPVPTFFPYMNGLLPTYATSTTLTITPGICNDSSSRFQMPLTSALTLNSAVNGVNALDTGTFAEASFYTVYLIGDVTGENPLACVMSLSAVSPLMPTGYGMWRKLGTITTLSGSAAFPVFYVTGGQQRTFTYDAPISVLSAGAATSFTAINCSAAIPPGTVQQNYLTPCVLSLRYTPATAANAGALRPTGSSSTGGLFVFNGQVTSQLQENGNVPMLAGINSGFTATEIDYKVGNASDTLAVSVVSYTLSI